MNISVSKDLDELSSAAAQEFIRLANVSIAERGRFIIALSGGSTPKALYKKLVSTDVDWTNVVFFFGDERNVSTDDEQSNFRMADENLFQVLGNDSGQVHRWKTELIEPQQVAADYSKSLKGLSNSDIPQFDLILLGMGSDGHTASLFPHTQALAEKEKLAVANWVPQLDIWRYTLTFPVINNARNIMFLVAGPDKSQTLKRVLEGERNSEELPSQSVKPANGELAWFLDDSAASLLE